MRWRAGCWMRHVRASLTLGPGPHTLRWANRDVSIWKEHGKAAATSASRRCKAIANKRGKISDSEFGEVRQAGFSDAQIITIAALTAQFLMTNFMNNVSQIDVDFPPAAKAKAA
jgi:hypothetical protein